MLETVDLVDHPHSGAVIKVIGVGGGGGNAVRYMTNHNVDGVEFICANTDSQALQQCGSVDPKSASQPKVDIMRMGNNTTQGLGAGTNPEVGKLAAMEDKDKIVSALKGTDMVFITTGMGGGTGTGAAPVIASIAKEMGILTVAVVTRPFPFEGKRRMKIAEEGIKELAESVDSLITIPNEKLLNLLGKDAPLTQAFAKADDVLCGAVRGIADIIKRPGMVNVDFADVKAVMSEMGMALMGTGSSTGSNRAREATEGAIHNPLLADVDLRGARGILVNITSGTDITLGEYSEVGRIIEEFASDDAIVKIGTVIDQNYRDELHVTVVATGLEMASSVAKRPVAPAHVEPQHAPSRQANSYEQARREQPSHHVEYQQPITRSQPVEPAHPGFDHREPAPVYETQAPYYDQRPDQALAHVQMTRQEPHRQVAAQPRASRPLTNPGNFSQQVQEELDIPAFLRHRRN